MKTKILTLLTLFIISFTNTTAQENKTEVKEQSFEQVIKPYVVKLLQGVKKGVDFAQQEVPIVIEQYLVFQSVKYGFKLLLSVVLLVLPLYFRKLWWLNKKPFDEDDYVEKNGRYKHFALYYIIPIVSYGMGALFFIFNIMPFIKVTFFPKLYLVEHFINILK